MIINLQFIYCRGHNEIDDPSFTQPTMYQIIENRPRVPDAYADSLVRRGVVTHEQLQKDASDYTAYLNNELKLADNVTPNTSHLEGHWKGLVQASEDKITTWDTGSRAWYKKCVSLNVASWRNFQCGPRSGGTSRVSPVSLETTLPIKKETHTRK